MSKRPWKGSISPHLTSGPCSPGPNASLFKRADPDPMPRPAPPQREETHAYQGRWWYSHQNAPLRVEKPVATYRAVRPGSARVASRDFQYGALDFHGGSTRTALHHTRGGGGDPSPSRRHVTLDARDHYIPEPASREYYQPLSAAKYSSAEFPPSRESFADRENTKYSSGEYTSYYSPARVSEGYFPPNRDPPPRTVIGKSASGGVGVGGMSAGRGFSSRDYYVPASKIYSQSTRPSSAQSALRKSTNYIPLSTNAVRPSSAQPALRASYDSAVRMQSLASGQAARHDYNRSGYAPIKPENWCRCDDDDYYNASARGGERQGQFEIERRY